jgi:hypothetical protein
MLIKFICVCLVYLLYPSICDRTNTTGMNHLKKLSWPVMCLLLPLPLHVSVIIWPSSGINIHYLKTSRAVRGAAVGWGTALQAWGLRVRFLKVSLGCFIDMILPAALWSLSRLNLKKMDTKDISWGVRTAGLYGWLTSHLRVPTGNSGNLKLLEP